MLSVLAVQDRLTAEEDTAVAERLVGVEGGVVSGLTTKVVRGKKAHFGLPDILFLSTFALIQFHATWPATGSATGKKLAAA
jgi:hypothetical protein